MGLVCTPLFMNTCSEISAYSATYFVLQTFFGVCHTVKAQK